MALIKDNDWGARVSKDAVLNEAEACLKKAQKSRPREKEEEQIKELMGEIKDVRKHLKRGGSIGRPSTLSRKR